MSNLSVNTITNAAGGNTAQINGMTPTGDSLQGFRNRIINGDMRIAQRGTGSLTADNSVFPVDRFRTYMETSGKGTVQQNAGGVTPPTGFINYFGYTSNTTFSPGSSESYAITHRIEGNNIADLGFGTANAQNITLSFWVRSSLTGLFGGSLMNSAINRNYVFSYSINAANTWEFKTITLTADTSGTWLTDNGIGLQIYWNLGSNANRLTTAGAWASGFFTGPTGAVNVLGTNGATFFITGVQLEAGAVATPFERRPFGTELQLCQRYYEKAYYAMTAAVAVATIHITTAYYRVTKRATPTIVYTTGEGTASTFQNYTESLAISGVPGGNQRIDGSFTSSAEL